LYISIAPESTEGKEQPEQAALPLPRAMITERLAKLYAEPESSILLKEKGDTARSYRKTVGLSHKKSGLSDLAMSFNPASSKQLVKTSPTKIIPYWYDPASIKVLSLLHQPWG
jgi:hypothetical protein